MSVEKLWALDLESKMCVNANAERYQMGALIPIPRGVTRELYENYVCIYLTY